MPKDSSTSSVRDTRGLSGGERSFSTLCFTLALHEMTESPSVQWMNLMYLWCILNRSLHSSLKFQVWTNMRNFRYFYCLVGREATVFIFRILNLIFTKTR